jgi:ferrous iron transport protein A
MEKIHITDLAQGDCVRLVSFGSTPLVYRQRLLSLGVTRGVEAKIIRAAPLGCPLQIEIRGTSITLRKDEAAELKWEII